jgi:hypothetical protein
VSEGHEYPLVKVEMTKMMIVIWFLFHIFDGKCVGEMVGRIFFGQTRR